VSNKGGFFKRFILNSWPFFLAPLIFVIIKISVKNPGFIEHYFSEGIYPITAIAFSWFSHLFPFSLWDVFWVVFILLILTGLTLVIFKKIKFKWYVLRLAQFLALLYSLFYLTWGFNYFRPGLEERVNWKKPKADEQVFRSILDTIIIRANSSQTTISKDDYAAIDKLVEDSYRKNSSELGIGYPAGVRRPKKMIFSSFFAKMGVNGYFGPFFNEIHLNSFLLPVEYPFILAHEKAHQFGIASEAEANLAAFVICSTSEDKRLQYSGYVYLLGYFLSDAAHLKDQNEYVKKISKPVMAEMQFLRKYHQGLENRTLRRAQTKANNVYLKSNHIKSGVRNYNQVVALTISWYSHLYQNNGTKN
jgi:hypothetical protein